MESIKIDLRHDPELMQLKNRRGWNWFIIFWSAMLLVQLVIIVIRLSDPERGWQNANFFILCLQPLVAIAFIVRGVYAMRKDQQVFVVFDPNKIRFRDKPGDEITVIPLEQLQSMEPHTFGAYFYLKNGTKVHLNWEQADYKNIQQIKQQLQKLKPLVKV